MSPGIYYLSPAIDRARGGIKQIYRHVDILNRQGHRAAVVHGVPGRRATWFDNTTEVIDGAEFRARFQPGTDFIVAPESLGLEILKFPPRRVIFNQNVYYGFAALGEDRPDPDPYRTSESVITVSDHNAELLRFAFSDLVIERVRCGVDGTVFRPQPLRDKKRQIVCVADKGATTNLTLFHVLAARGVDVPWVFLRGRSQAEVAQLLRESLIVVFASAEEGFGLVPVEAMLSGCIVLTHATGPQRESTPEPCLFAEHDIVGMATAIETILRASDAELDRWQEICDAGRTRAAESYSLEREESSVLAVWERILSRPAPQART